MRAGRAVRRSLIGAVALTGLLAMGAGGFYVYVESGGNLHTVEAGAVYRSRQLSGAELERVVGAYGIRSVLNLRGAHPGKDWYDDELAVADARDLVHYDYKLSARRRVTPAQIDEILGIIQTAPKPLLMHCKAGADRTGLIAAAYLFAHGAPPAQAEGALSLRFGHFPWLGSRTRAMDESFDAYVAATK